MSSCKLVQEVGDLGYLAVTIVDREPRFGAIQEPIKVFNVLPEFVARR